MKLYQNYKKVPIYESESGFCVKLGKFEFTSSILMQCKTLIDLMFGIIILKVKLKNKKTNTFYFKEKESFVLSDLLKIFHSLFKNFDNSDEIKLGFNTISTKFDIVFNRNNFTTKDVLSRLTNRAVQIVENNKSELVLNTRLVFNESNEYIYKGKEIKEEKVSEMPLRVKILRDVESLITKDRINKHGNPEDSFNSIADFWNCYLRNKFKVEINLVAEDVCMLMSLMKHARYIQNPSVEDNIVDIIGYAANAFEQRGKNEEKGSD